MEAVQGSSEAGVSKIISVRIHLTWRKVKQLHGKLNMNTDFKALSFHTVFNEAYPFCDVTLGLFASQSILMLNVYT